MQTINATEFKAKCLDLLDRVGAAEIDALGITKHGKVVAWLIQPPPESAAVRGIHGFMRDSVVVSSGIDLTAPVLDEAFSASDGHLHR